MSRLIVDDRDLDARVRLEQTKLTIKSIFIKNGLKVEDFARRGTFYRKPIVPIDDSVRKLTGDEFENGCVCAPASLFPVKVFGGERFIKCQD
jgi:hypothetical protein